MDWTTASVKVCWFGAASHILEELSLAPIYGNSHLSANISSLTKSCVLVGLKDILIFLMNTNAILYLERQVMGM